MESPLVCTSGEAQRGRLGIPLAGARGSAPQSGLLLLLLFLIPVLDWLKNGKSAPFITAARRRRLWCRIQELQDRSWI